MPINPQFLVPTYIYDPKQQQPNFNDKARQKVSGFSRIGESYSIVFPMKVIIPKKNHQNNQLWPFRVSNALSLSFHLPIRITATDNVLFETKCYKPRSTESSWIVFSRRVSRRNQFVLSLRTVKLLIPADHQVILRSLIVKGNCKYLILID